jgi:acetyltransferase
LPTAASIENPVDVLAGSGPAIYALALHALLADPGVDAVLVIVVPQEWFLPTGLAEVIGEMASLYAKPVLASLMGSAAADEARQVLHQWRVPGFAFPEQAASALAAMARRQEWLQQPEGTALEPAEVAAWRPAGRAALARREWSGGLAAYGIRLPAARLAANGDEAVQAARDIGFPVALKLASSHISHKSEVGGVVLNVADAAAVSAAYRQVIETARAARPDATLLGVWVQPMLSGGQEIIVGIRRDAQFGPLVLVGSGGIEVELQRDVALDMAPLTYAQAERLLDETQAGARLKGWRGAPPGDRTAVLDTIVRLAQLACDLPEIAELEINPLVVLPAGLGALAVDVRGVLAAGQPVV